MDRNATVLDEQSNEARERLRTAIAAKEAAAGALARASKAAASAKGLLDTVAAAVVEYANLDDVVTAYRAESIRIWSTADERQEQPSMDLPETLKEEIRRRQEAVDRLDAAKTAYAVLAEDRTKAQRGFEAADRAVQAAVDQVLIVDAQAVADELGRQQAFVDALRFRLRAFLKIQRPSPIAAHAGSAIVGGGYGPLIVSARMRELSEYPREPFSSAMIQPDGAEARNWDDYRRRLIGDPDSTLDR